MIFSQGRNKHRSELIRREKPSAAKLHLHSCIWAFVAAAALLATSASALQDSPALKATRPRHTNHAAATQQQSSGTGFDLEKYKPLLEELGRLEKRIEQNVKFPAPRTQSKLLPLVPAGSSFFVSFPNYGDAIHQANQIFLEELKQSPVLGDWWKNQAGPAGTMVEDGIEKFYQFTEYLGNEVVVAGTVNQKSASVVVIAEARKPGLKAFIDQIIQQYAPQPKPPVRVLTPQQLLTAKTQRSYKPLLILVRPDYIVASTDLPTLQNFNAHLTRGGAGFTANPFGQRLTQTYASGASVVAGIDLQKMLALRPRGSAENEHLFQQSGFADLKYLIVEGKYENGMASTNAELSFNGPRHGIASWLAGPAPLPGLDFISTDSAYTFALNLKPPAQIFDELRLIGENTNPFAGVALAQAESELKINIKDDLLSKFGGHFTVALDGPIAPIPAWKVIAQVSDPAGLQQTIRQLLTAANEKANGQKNFSLDQQTEAGLNYYTLRISDSPKPIEVHYTFADGYLIVGGTHAIVKDAIALHRNGNSLPRSADFNALAPQKFGSQASALIYENPALFLASALREVSPELQHLFAPDTSKIHGIVATTYAEDSAINFVSNSKGFDMTTMLLVAAVAIPNIMRSKNVANEAAATATVRTVMTAQAQYSLDYNKGYAPDLGTLGNCGGGKPSPAHACLIDDKLGCPDTWCVKNNFRYNLTGVCKAGQCDNYVVGATPLSTNDGGKSFCATADGVVHWMAGAPLTEPISVSECDSWPSNL